MHSTQLVDYSPSPTTGTDPIPPATLRRAVSMPLANGSTPTMCTFDGLAGSRGDDFALQFGVQDGTRPAAVRVHSSCITGDLFGSQRCDCGPQLREALDWLAGEGGVLIYLQQEGRGIGLRHKIDAYDQQDQGLDTFTANRVLGFRDDERDYVVAAQILDVLLPGTAIRLLSNNPDKAVALERYGIQVQERIPTGVFATAANHRYLQAKRAAGHQLSL